MDDETTFPANCNSCDKIITQEVGAAGCLAIPGRCLRVLARTAVPHSCTTPALRLAHLTTLQEDTGYNLCDECCAQDGGPMAHHARDPYCISGARGVIYMACRMTQVRVVGR